MALVDGYTVIQNYLVVQCNSNTDDLTEIHHTLSEGLSCDVRVILEIMGRFNKKWIQRKWAIYLVNECALKTYTHLKMASGQFDNQQSCHMILYHTEIRVKLFYYLGCHVMIYIHAHWNLIGLLYNVYILNLWPVIYSALFSR